MQFKFLITISILFSEINGRSSTNLATIQTFIEFYTLRSNSDRSELCENQSKVLLNAVYSEEPWALRMIDASAKFPSGIMKLHLSDVGYFDECIQIKNENISFTGKYCLSTIEKADIDSPQSHLNIESNPFTKSLVFSWAICVPSGCTATEVENHLNAFLGEKIFKIEESTCQTQDTAKSKLNAGDWTVLIFLGILSVIILLSTSYDVFLFYSKKETCNQICIAFSWLTNLRKLTKISNNPTLLPSLNGIRFLSMLWIILGHQYEMTPLILCTNLLDADDWFQRFSSMLINGSTVSVDSFFLLSGCLLMYGFLRTQAKKIPFNIPLFYLHRYLRLTPAYAAAIIFRLTLFRFMGSGPLWDPENTDDKCKPYWWAALLYIQNYVASADQCVGQTWYLQVDMQLYILSPLILIPISKWPKIAPYMLSALLFVSVLIPTIIAWHYKLAAYMAVKGGAEGDPSFLDIYYLQTYARAGPWVLGLLLGYILFYSRNKRIDLNRYIIVLLWIISTGAMLYTVFGFYHETKPDYQYERVFNALFIGLHRVVWSAGLCWIIFACTHGYGGPVNWFLSLNIFQFLSKLTYSMFLTHISIQQIHLYSLQMPFIFSNIHNWYAFCGSLSFVLIISLIWTLTFESPFVILDSQLMKLISGQNKKTKQSENAREEIGKET